MLEDEYSSEYTAWKTQQWDRGYASGLRKGVCRACVRIYRNWNRPDKRQKLEQLLEYDFFQEVSRFHEKYGNIPIDQMVTYLLTESEYLINWFD